MPSQTDDVKKALLEKAREVGFDTLGVAGPDGRDGMYDRYQNFIDKNRHGDMDWMDKRHEHRASPRHLWPECKSVIMLGMNYNREPDPLAHLSDPLAAGVSIYARGRDYHDVVKKKLKELGRWIASTYDCDIKVFVDTAPVMEKPLAAEAGIGWQGKHTNLVSSEIGSWFFLGAIFTTLPLDPDIPHSDQCGSCRACLDACPTDAFPAPYQLDARRCISYLTIEHDGPFEEEFRHKMGNRIYGCDDCLAACPWNKFAHTASEQRYDARVFLQDVSLFDIIQLDDARFRTVFTKSPIKRTGRDKLVRNALYALGNARGQSILSDDIIKTITALTQDNSAMVADAAQWALDNNETINNKNP